MEKDSIVLDDTFEKMAKIIDIQQLLYCKTKSAENERLDMSAQRRLRILSVSKMLTRLVSVLKAAGRIYQMRKPRKFFSDNLFCFVF